VATTGAEARADLEALRGAEVPLFHGTGRVRGFSRNFGRITAKAAREVSSVLVKMFVR
jgi:hypothetical protein